MLSFLYTTKVINHRATVTHCLALYHRCMGLGSSTHCCAGLVAFRPRMLCSYCMIVSEAGHLFRKQEGCNAQQFRPPRNCKTNCTIMAQICVQLGPPRNTFPRFFIKYNCLFLRLHKTIRDLELVPAQTPAGGRSRFNGRQT